MLQRVLLAGVEALWQYVALHVVTCLVPAFLLAGAMVALVSREAIVAYLGEASGKLRSFSLAAVGSLFLAACSCTVIPVASGLYASGAGIGAAFIVLWVAPAANVLALTYTGALLGWDMTALRLLVALLTALAVGGMMTWAFSRPGSGGGRAPAAGSDPPQASSAVRGAGTGPGVVSDRSSLVFLGLLVLSLLAPNYVVRSGPYLHKVAVWAAVTAGAVLFAWCRLSAQQRWRWLQESWWFVRLIFPLLLVGVFLVGVVSAVLPPAWVERWLGGSGPGATFMATLIGAISYFATMTEAPFVARLMEMGMGRGPALALLLAGPGLSLPNMLTIGRVFGARQATVYVTAVVVLATLFGWVAGTWVL